MSVGAKSGLFDRERFPNVSLRRCFCSSSLSKQRVSSPVLSHSGEIFRRSKARASGCKLCAGTLVNKSWQGRGVMSAHWRGYCAEDQSPMGCERRRVSVASQ